MWTHSRRALTSRRLKGTGELSGRPQIPTTILEAVHRFQRSMPAPSHIRPGGQTLKIRGFSDGRKVWEMWYWRETFALLIHIVGL